MLKKNHFLWYQFPGFSGLFGSFMSSGFSYYSTTYSLTILVIFYEGFLNLLYIAAKHKNIDTINIYKYIFFLYIKYIISIIIINIIVNANIILSLSYHFLFVFPV